MVVVSNDLDSFGSTVTVRRGHQVDGTTLSSLAETPSLTPNVSLHTVDDASADSARPVYADGL